MADDKPKTSLADELKKAVALQYDQQKDAVPTLTAKGRGDVAEKILALAKEHKIPIKEDKDLVMLLEALEVDQEIPLELYAVVAEIFSYIYNMNKQKRAAL